ncbi:MAG TPA: restriction endonuclease [Ramlibacter sp.]
MITNVTQSPSADALNGMSWHEFEMLVGEAFRLQGYAVEEQGGAQPDGGVDLVARKGTETFLVQCKQWKALKVGVDVVRQLYGVMAARGAAGGFVVTSGRFTDDAISFAAGRNVRLVDGPKLFGLLQQARAARPTRAPAASSTAQAVRPAAVRSSPSDSASTPPCPVCNAPMVRRTARKGTNAGSEFWGCSTFPKCRGAR